MDQPAYSVCVLVVVSSISFILSLKRPSDFERSDCSKPLREHQLPDMRYHCFARHGNRVARVQKVNHLSITAKLSQYSLKLCSAFDYLLLPT